MAHGSKSDSGHFFAITRHDEYFLAGGDLYLMVSPRRAKIVAMTDDSLASIRPQVDHVQFRVHRYFFERESPFFRTKLAGPASPGAQRMGNAESTAIILDGLKPAEFARFLWVFYNPYVVAVPSLFGYRSYLSLAANIQFIMHP